MSSSSLRRNRHQQQSEKNVFRLKNSMPGKFQEMLLKYLANTTEMKQHDLEVKISKITPEKVPLKRKNSILFYKKSIKKRDVAHLTPDTIAAMTTLMDFLGKSSNITSEGLFRKIGSICRQKTMRKQLLGNSAIDFENVSSHDGANVLKNFLRDLQEPLLTHQFRNVYHYLASSLTTSDKSKATTLKTLQLLMLLLPGDNYCLLRPLMALLHRTSNTQENLMTASSLALMFTPHFLCSKSTSGRELQTTTNTFSTLVAFMIEHGHNLFRIPQDLADEVSNFWKEMEIPNHLYIQSVTKKNHRPLKTLDDSCLADSPAKTPKKKSARRSLVHVIDCGISPNKRRQSWIFSSRRRQSSESSEASLPEKRPLPEVMLPQLDDSSNAHSQPEPIQWKFPSSSVKGKPVALVKPFTRSPISDFFRKVPQSIQKVMQTPRSRTPMTYQSPQHSEIEVSDDENEIMV